MPQRSPSDKQNEEKVINYLLNEDKCTVASPIVNVEPSKGTPQTQTNQNTASEFDKNYLNNKFDFEFTPQNQQWGPNIEK